MEKAKIDRINQLARKSRTAGLNDAETAEQASLRAEYIAEIRASFTGTLENTVLVRPDGTRERVSERRKK